MAKRTINFSAEEEDILLNVVCKYAHIVECKQTDHINNRKKDAVWQHIEKDFNSQSSSSHRNAEALRTKYKNIKKRSKKKFSDEKIFNRGTGGGPPVSIEMSESDHIVASILGNRLTGFNSHYDDEEEQRNLEFEEVLVTSTSYSNDIEYCLERSETETFNNNANSSGKYSLPNKQICSEQTGPLLRTPVSKPVRNDNPLDGCSTKATSDGKYSMSVKQDEQIWSGQTAPLLRTQVSTPLRNNSLDGCNALKRRKELQDGMSNWARGKVALNDLNQELLREEHNNKQIRLKVEHEAKLKREEDLHALQAKEIEMRIKNMEEKHHLEMHYLKLQIEAKQLEILKKR